MHEKESIIMKLGNNKNARRPGAAVTVYGIITLFFVLVLLQAAKDIVIQAISDTSEYEVKQIQMEELGNGQQVWALFKDGEYYKDVDYNEYCALDSEGNTDYGYCLLTNNVKGLIYAVILCSMMVLGMLIAYNAEQGTPFTKKNVNMIRAIGFLQLALTVLPGMAGFVMRFIRFDYVSSGFSMNSVYMFLIACVIMLIAQVFDYGVKLQEDSDSIA